MNNDNTPIHPFDAYLATWRATGAFTPKQKAAQEKAATTLKTYLRSKGYKLKETVDVMILMLMGTN